MVQRPINKTARTVEIFRRKVGLVDRRRGSGAGSVFGVPKDPFPSWGRFWVAGPALAAGYRHDVGALSD